MKRLLSLLLLVLMPSLACAQSAPLVFNSGRVVPMANSQAITVGQLNLTTPSNVGFAPGPTSATAGSIAQTDWVWNNGSQSVTSIGSLWTNPINVGVGISRTFTSGSASAPQISFATLVTNNGTPSDAVSNMTHCYLKTATGSCFGQNIIVYTDSSLSNVKTVGLEIDLQPGTGTTLTGASNGLILNQWTVTNPASAISINIANSGKWTYGLQCASGSTVNACITVPPGSAANGIEIQGSTGHGNAAAFYNSSDTLTINSGANGFALKDQTGASSRLVVTGSSAQILVPAILPSYTVATLPACVTGLKGGLAYVTDATAPAYNAALTGGGAVVVPVFCNGSAWTSH